MAYLQEAGQHQRHGAAKEHHEINFATIRSRAQVDLDEQYEAARCCVKNVLHEDKVSLCEQLVTFACVFMVISRCYSVSPLANQLLKQGTSSSSGLCDNGHNAVFNSIP